MAAVDATTGSGKTQKIIYVNEQTKEIDFNYLKEITDDFSKDRIIGGGQAGGGTAYMGGEAIVVNKLQQKAPVPRDETFKDKLQTIVALKHENIVKFVGYCSEVQKRSAQHQGTSTGKDVAESFLCYEYLSKGSLHDYLRDVKSAKIDWDKHFKIIEGICQGLLFLHKRDQPIIHMDLKPENILLDDNLTPKIADFGIAIHFDKGQDRMYTDTVVGSYAYMAPEFLYGGEISFKTDIYSLGLLIIQITTGEQIFPEKEPSARKYIDKICENWTEEHIASKYSSLDSYCLQQVKACIKIGMECVEIDPENRPSIDKIVDELNERRAS